MEYTVIGIAHRSGDYNGQKYDNYNVYAVRNALSDKGEFGQIAEVFKVPASNYKEMSVGDTFDNVYYDRYQRVIGFSMT